MAIAAENKILVALDGSARSFEAVKYISGVSLFREKPVHVTLFTVYNAMPKCYRDLGKDPQFSQAYSEVKRWELEKKRRYEAFLEKSKNTLLEAGFKAENILCIVRKKQVGIARDIIKEAHKGYDALVIGRKGSGMMKGLNLGSVAAKIVTSLTDMPLAVVGRNVPVTGKVLMPLDGSEYSNRSIDFVGVNLAGSDLRIHLLHVIRDGEDCTEEDEIFIKREIGKILENAKEHLLGYKLRPEQISMEVRTRERSRAAAILKEAQQLKIGTIVMGRKGISRISDFFIGRVSNKVIQMARFSAVWLIV